MTYYPRLKLLELGMGRLKRNHKKTWEEYSRGIPENEIVDFMTRIRAVHGRLLKNMKSRENFYVHLWITAVIFDLVEQCHPTIGFDGVRDLTGYSWGPDHAAGIYFWVVKLMEEENAKLPQRHFASDSCLSFNHR